MKKLSIFSLFLFGVFTVFGQQALKERPIVTSPVVAEDGVSFAVFAPNASEVSVVGDFLGYRYDLVKDSTGVWRTTLTDLTPEIYIYRFDIDGLLTADPANVYTKRDISTTYSMLFVPGETTENYAVKDVPHGTVSRVWYPSTSTGVDRRMSVYTPPGYESSGKTYPVLYLLHGMGGDEEAWLTLGRCAQIMDNLIAEGLAEPMIVVMPNGNIALESAPGESPQGFYAPTIQLPNTMDGTFEKSFHEIVDFVDSTYRTKADKHNRAVAGLSMGGFHSLNISALYPDTFDYIGLFSAAIYPRENSQDELFANRDELLATLFRGKPALYWIGIGDEDFLYDANKEFRLFLTNNSYPFEYYESDGGHIWKNWRKYLSKFAGLIFK